MPLTLRPYQAESVAAVWNYIRRSTGSPLVVIPTGGGKSVCISQICLDAVQRWNGRVAVVTHVKELIEQLADHLGQLLPPGMVGLYSAGVGRRDTQHPVIVAGIQSVYNRACELGAFNIIIADECFPAGTLISTPRGKMPIEKIRVGQPIYHALGVGAVEAISARPESHLIALEFDDGTTVTCTPNHPLFTSRGWTQAGRLETRSDVFSMQDVQMLREEIYTLDKVQSGRIDIQPCQRKAMGTAAILFDILLQEASEPYGEQKGKTGTERDAKAHTSQTNKAGREWEIASDRTIGASPCIGGGMGGRVCCTDTYGQRDGLSNELQNRHSESIQDDRVGIGREYPSSSERSDCRHEEGVVFGSKRLVRITHVKSSCPTPVFNLHVSGHPSYYAGDILVHNCHLIPESGEGRYLTFLRDAKTVNPSVRLIGFTATPYRLNSGKICKPDNMLNDICYDANVREMIIAGWLCPLRTRKGIECANLSDVKIASTGDFANDEMQRAFENVIQPACTEIATLCADRHSVLIFAAGIEHARIVADTLGGEVVTGKTSKTDRASIIERFKKGETKYLVNVGVLTTGFDAPNVDAVVLLRATMSAGLYVQMVGRGLRKHPSKTDCLILDFGDNAIRHGPVDQIEVQDKKKRGQSDESPAKACPNCKEVIAVQYRVCPHCEYEFPAASFAKHESHASDAPILSGEPIVETHDVQYVNYTEHSKNAVTLRAEYVLNPLTGKSVSQYLCFNHAPGSYARRVAEQWWRERSNAPMPGTVMDALALIRKGALINPASVTISKKPGDKYQDIVGFDLGVVPEYEAIEESDEDFFSETASAVGADANDIPF